ncbi:nucleoside triphosphate pyrophosphohydrolase [Actinomadura rayongensis]|uniref:nucleoside triphosphate pyrophosphohydrolase n=1 Tax=Actinomadura rayongensis TaxID=1429076 RepID=UPI001F45D88E|nr:nucleoside triphosphate pyrophosphohydrolase [Actinomadura rayongensis]
MDGKLVRDRIPEIIRASGAEPVTYIADETEYRQRLRDKLREETAEACAADPSDLPGELADVLEVVHALAAAHGLTPARLEEIRAAKSAARGAFTARTVWTGNRP